MYMLNRVSSRVVGHITKVVIHITQGHYYAYTVLLWQC